MNVAEKLRRQAALCRSWLIRHDPEGRDFWRSLSPDADFAGAVIDNVRDFGIDVTGQADFALEVLP